MYDLRLLHPVSLGRADGGFNFHLLGSASNALNHNHSNTPLHKNIKKNIFSPVKLLEFGLFGAESGLKLPARMETEGLQEGSDHAPLVYGRHQ